MKDDLFEELMTSVREGGAILRGEQAPSRSFTVEAPDVKMIRQQFELSQRDFSKLLGISLGTLRNWEQGRRTPRGSARVLLKVAAKYPTEVWSVVRDELRQRPAAARA